MRIVLETNILARANPRSKSVARSFANDFGIGRARVGFVAVSVARNGTSVELSPLASPLAAGTLGYRAIDTGSSGFRGVG
jgi:hypothetical protein